MKCCSKEYVYDAPCVYPLVTKGRCGNKYKCECDSSQYKYTDNECKTTKGSAGEGYENSYGSGSFCTQQRYDTDSHGIVSEIRYSSCQCDRGIYPKFGIEDRARPFREIFHMPENIRPLSLIVLGHTDQEFKAQERFRAERVHNEDW